MLDRIGQCRVELAGQAEYLRKQLVDIELELADLTNWSFSPFREASEAARTVASRSRRSR